MYEKGFCQETLTKLPFDWSRKIDQQRLCKSFQYSVLYIMKKGADSGKGRVRQMKKEKS